MSTPQAVEHDGTVYPSVSAMAKALGVSRSTVDRWVKRGDAKHVGGGGRVGAARRRWRRTAMAMLRAGRHPQAQAALLYAEAEGEWL